MPSLDDAYEQAAPIAPFSNSTDGDGWTRRWCENCVHEADCPLLLTAMIARTPAQWRSVNPGGTHDMYDCSMYEQAEGAPNARADGPGHQGGAR
jgi:hypothetical protein